MLRRFIQVVALASAVLSSAALAIDRPNILVIWGDDIGFWNLSTNNMGMMGYQTPNIDRIPLRVPNSPTTTDSKAALRGGRRLSPANHRFAPA